MNELLRPWKLATLAAGIALLIAGSYVLPAPDWGVADSVVLAVFAYITAPWVVRVWFERRWKWMPLAAYWTWMGADGLYTAWWMMVDPAALAMMGEAAIPANYALYGIAGLIWAPRGSLREIIAKVPVFMRGAARLG